MGKTFSDVRTDFCDHLSTEQRRTLDAWEGRLIDRGCSKLHLGTAHLPGNPSVEDYVLAVNYARASASGCSGAGGAPPPLPW